MNTDTQISSTESSDADQAPKKEVGDTELKWWFEDRDQWNQWAHDSHLVLSGDQALALWRKGCEIWNEWTAANPKADISFQGVSFSGVYKAPGEEVSFVAFIFPRKGLVDFSGAEFGEGNVDFCGAEFGEGNVDFCGAEFGEGDVNFRRAEFGGGDVNFSGAKFGEGEVDFKSAEFGEGDVNFSSAEFGENVYFESSEFKGETISFVSSKFNRYLGFINTKINDQADLSFRLSSFNGPVEFSTVKPIRAPDFVGTKTTHHFILSGLKHSFKRKWFQNDREQADSLCRLKEIAENNKDYHSSLRFHAGEMRAARWNWPVWSDFLSAFSFIIAFFGGVLDWLYSVCSSYGQSVVRPVVGFLVVFVMLLHLTINESNAIEAKSWHFFMPNDIPDAFTGGDCTINCTDVLYAAATISLSKSVPFLGGVGLEAREAREKLHLSPGYGFWSSILSGFSFLFMFLIGLGLRNKFRLR